MAEQIKKKKTGALYRTLSVIGIVLCLVFGFLLICNLTIIVKGTLHPERPPALFGTTTLVVKSGSMSGNAEGHIEVGDLIFVGKADPDKLREGDVIAFMTGGSVTTHRIVSVETGEDGRPQWTTRGDANNVEDKDPVTEENLVGIYQFRIPKVGDFAFFLQTPLGMVLFIGVPLLAFIIYDILRRQHYANVEKKKTDELEAQLQAEIERLRSVGKLADEAVFDEKAAAEKYETTSSDEE